MRHLEKVMTLSFFIAITTTLYGQNQVAVKLDNQIKSVVIDSVRRALLQYYVFPDLAKSMSSYLTGQVQKGAYDTITNPHRLAQLLSRDLLTMREDNHLSIRYDPALEQRINSFNRAPRTNGAANPGERRQNFFFKQVAILPGNIGYIDFTNFADTSTQARNTVRAAMQFVAYTDALLIDLRNNGGGSGPMASEMLSYFFNKPTRLGRTYSRLTNGWTESWAMNNVAVTHGLYMGMPVYLLTSRRTFSAAEGLAYTLQHLTQATVVGDTTQGGAHLTRSFALGNGFVGFIPYSRGENVVTKTDWEKTGVTPTVAIDESHALVKAQQAYWATKLGTAKSEEEKRKVTWQLNRLTGQSASLSVPVSVLAQYAGQFEEFVFTVQDGQLVSTNLSRKGKKDKLVALSPTLFQIDSESQVEFIKDADGKFTRMKLLFDDGWEGILMRNK